MLRPFFRVSSPVHSWQSRRNRPRQRLRPLLPSQRCGSSSARAATVSTRSRPCPANVSASTARAASGKSRPSCRSFPRRRQVLERFRRHRGWRLLRNYPRLGLSRWCASSPARTATGTRSRPRPGNVSASTARAVSGRSRPLCPECGSLACDNAGFRKIDPCRADGIGSGHVYRGRSPDDPLRRGLPGRSVRWDAEPFRMVRRGEPDPLT
jgi:hypothetical protein